MKLAYGTALACAIGPLVTGMSIYIAWRVTDDDGLVGAGLLNIYVGLACFVLGILALIRFWHEGKHKAGYPRKRLEMLTAACGLLLFANFPAALVIASKAAVDMASYTVVVHNKSSDAIQEMTVMGGGKHLHFGSISPSETATHRFWIDHDGALELTAQHNDTTYQHELDGYVTHGIGNYVMVTVTNDKITSVDATGITKATKLAP